MFTVDPTSVTVYSDGRLCSSEACNNAQTRATIAVTESRYVNIVRVLGKIIQNFKTHNLQVVDA